MTIKKSGSGFKVVSEKGKSLGGPYPSKAAAEHRLKQVDYFKHRAPATKGRNEPDKGSGSGSGST